MELLLASVRGALTGKMVMELDNDGPTGRFSVVNDKGNKLIQGASPDFLASLREKGMLKESGETREEMYARLFADS